VAYLTPEVGRRTFLSYGHDEHLTLALRMKQDLEGRGHVVWFDAERLKPGADCERYIEEGLEWAAAIPQEGRVVLIMTPHSVRRPDGYCLNEVARALSRRLTVVPAMVVWCEPPLSICRAQWLDMRDCVPLEAQAGKYESKFVFPESQRLYAVHLDHHVAEDWTESLERNARRFVGTFQEVYEVRLPAYQACGLAFARKSGTPPPRARPNRLLAYSRGTSWR
jgi:hypothetical protein